MSKNVVRKANKTIIAKILDQIREKTQVAQYYRNQDDSDNVSYFLHAVFEFRQTAFNLYLIGVFNFAEFDFFTWEYVAILVDCGFSSNDVWNEKNAKE